MKAVEAGDFLVGVGVQQLVAARCPLFQRLMILTMLLRSVLEAMTASHLILLRLTHLR